MWNPNPRFVALATARLGAVGVATAGIVSSRTPETPSGDGVAAGLGGIPVVCAVAGAFALVKRDCCVSSSGRRRRTSGRGDCSPLGPPPAARWSGPSDSTR